MYRRLHLLIFLVKWKLLQAREPELPLCPTNVQYFPQQLPMHCRMPRSANINMPSLYQSPRPETQPLPLPFPVPPLPPHQFPGLPMPPGLPGMPIPVPGPIPMPMPMGMAPPSHKLPVIVMPFYSPDPLYKKDEKKNFFDKERDREKRKKRRKIKIHTRWPIRYDSGSSTSSDTSSSTDDSSDGKGGWWKGYKKNFRRSNRRSKAKRRHKKKTDLLTPIIQYVTKDGYVIYEKEISKGEAKDWLREKNVEDNKVLNTDVGNGNENNDENKKNEEQQKEEVNKELEEIKILNSKMQQQLDAAKNKKPLKRKRQQFQKV